MIRAIHFLIAFFCFLFRAFRIFDDDYSNSLNFDEFVTGLRDYKVQLTDEVKQFE